MREEDPGIRELRDPGERESAAKALGGYGGRTARDDGGPPGWNRDYPREDVGPPGWNRDDPREDAGVVGGVPLFGVVALASSVTSTPPSRYDVRAAPAKPADPPARVEPVESAAHVEPGDPEKEAKPGEPGERGTDR
ncbi:hypothetical protein [Corynebacterium sp. 335C]